MKAKQVLSFILAVMLLASISIVAYAETDTKTFTEQDSMAKDVTVETQTIPVAYTVTIPAKVTIPYDSDKTTTADATVKVEGRLQPGDKITVSVPAGGSLESKTKSSEIAATLAYTVKAPSEVAGQVTVNAGDNNELTFIGQTSVKTELSAILTYTVENTAWAAAAAGVYSNTAVYSIEYASAAV